jgi:putative transposase
VVTVLRYIELNPVRARMVALPTEYHWSSVRTYLGRAKSQLITPQEVYLHLGCDAAERVPVYA